MEQIILTKFKAKDGCLFDLEKDCSKYENIVETVNDIMVHFGKLPKDEGCVFANGGGYIQHNKEYVENAKEKILKFGKKVLNIKKDISFYWLGRHFDDCGNKYLYHAWQRISNTDSKYREWGQGYYAINPDKGKQIEFKEY